MTAMPPVVEEEAPAPAPRPRVPRMPFVVVGVTVLVLAAAVALRMANPPDGDAPSDLNGTLLGTAQPRPDFTLTDTNGQPFDFAKETAGELTLLFFGYTSCPDVCPLHLANLAYAMEQPRVPKVTVVFVSVDTTRDTPEVIRSFLDRFDANFVGLTGTKEELRLAQEAAQVPVAITEEPKVPGGDFLVGHAAQVIAYTGDDQAHVVYPFGTRQQDWIEDLPRLYQGPWSGQ